MDATKNSVWWLYVLKLLNMKRPKPNAAIVSLKWKESNPLKVRLHIRYIKMDNQIRYITRLHIIAGKI